MSDPEPQCPSLNPWICSGVFLFLSSWQLHLYNDHRALSTFPTSSDVSVTLSPNYSTLVVGWLTSNPGNSQLKSQDLQLSVSIAKPASCTFLPLLPFYMVPHSPHWPWLFLSVTLALIVYILQSYTDSTTTSISSNRVKQVWRFVFIHRSFYRFIIIHEIHKTRYVQTGETILRGWDGDLLA